MRVVYFILSHANVAQVRRLIDRIRRDVPESLVVVHHDETNEPFDRAAYASDRNVYVLPRSIHGEWASYSLVEIVLYGLDDLQNRTVVYDWVVLLSGQDYPIDGLRAFEASLTHAVDGFIEADPQPGTLLDRYRFWWLRLPRALEHGAMHRLIGILTRFNARQPYVRFLSGRVGCRIGFAPRRLPLAAGMQIRKGTQWWALSARAIAFVRTFVAANPAFVDHFRAHTIMPDEAFFHTILSGAPQGFTFVNDDRRFTKWASAAAASPNVLGEADYADIVASGDAFARKFDPRIDSAIIDALDQRRST